jgi:hypothetical protein
VIPAHSKRTMLEHTATPIEAVAHMDKLQLTMVVIVKVFGMAETLGKVVPVGLKPTRQERHVLLTSLCCFVSGDKHPVRQPNFLGIKGCRTILLTPNSIQLCP